MDGTHGDRQLLNMHRLRKRKTSRDLATHGRGTQVACPAADDRVRLRVFNWEIVAVNGPGPGERDVWGNAPSFANCIALMGWLYNHELAGDLSPRKVLLDGASAEARYIGASTAKSATGMSTGGHAWSLDLSLALADQTWAEERRRRS